MYKIYRMLLKSDKWQIVNFKNRLSFVIDTIVQKTYTSDIKKHFSSYLIKDKINFHRKL